MGFTPRRVAPAYWVAAGSVTLLGLYNVFTFGSPVLLFGLALLVLGPFRRRRSVFWPGVAAVLAFISAFLLVMPLDCATSGNPTPPVSTWCRNALGVHWSRQGVYSPGYRPALIAGLVAGMLAALVARRLVTGRIATRPA